MRALVSPFGDQAMCWCGRLYPTLKLAEACTHDSSIPHVSGEAPKRPAVTSEISDDEGDLTFREAGRMIALVAVFIAVILIIATVGR